MKQLITSLVLVALSLQLMAQDINKEIGFIYTKAKYLLETERIEDAVRELNKVIKENGDFEDALLLRAEAKYVLGAYKGVKNDLNQYIAKRGITARVARLYGLCDYQGGNKKAALNSISLALNEIKDDRQLYELSAEMHEANGDKSRACADYQKAVKLGSTKSKRKVSALCGRVYTEPKTKTGGKTDAQPKGKDDEINDRDDRVIDETDKTSEKEDPKVEDENTNDDDGPVFEETEVNDDSPPNPQTDEDGDDGSINEIVVDEELTLLISGGNLGSRDVLRQPNILILADQSGEVAIDICVSKGGRITSAVFNNQLSSIKKQSLVSLAVRKSKEFWFEKRDGDDSCGVIVFKIKGTED